MGHLVGKDIYRQLGQKIDQLTMRAPWSDTLFAILKALYSEEEAELVVKMPYGLASFGRIQRVTDIEPQRLRPLLEGLCAKGLVMDLYVGRRYLYLPSPMVIGIFEYTMMRTRGQLDLKQWAELFHEYLGHDGTFFEANRGKVSILRTVPHEGTIRPEEYVEVLDYEKAATFIDNSQRFAVGLCSCRHEKHHLNAKECDVPLETCTSFNMAADFLIRNNLAREISKAEMHDLFAQSRDRGLVFNADNVQQSVGFVCHCCKCCCNALMGISKFGLAGAVVTSNYLAVTDVSQCTGCGVCAKSCPIDAISMIPSTDPKFKKHGQPKIDEEYCLGCGVCALKCKSGALQLTHRAQRVLHPADTFERVILQCLERGTLQNQLFDDPTQKSQAFLRGLIGGFLRLPPVKMALMSDRLRSRFLHTIRERAQKQGRRWVKDL